MRVVERVAEAARCTDVTRLGLLSQDRSPQVRREVAANPLNPGVVLDELAGDRDWRVRAAVGLHPATTDAGLCRLVGDPRWEVRLTMLDRPDLSLAVMIRVCESDPKDARHTLAGQQRIPLQVALALAEDPDWQVRRSLAENTVFEEVRAILRSDTRPVVREFAVDNAYQTRYRPADPERPPPDRRTPATPRFSAADLAHWPTLPRKPSTRWLKIDGNLRPTQDVIPPHVIWLWTIAKAIDADPAWTRWWRSAENRTLELYPAPAGRGDQVLVVLDEKAVQVVGCSSALTASTGLAFAGDEEQSTRPFDEVPPPMRGLMVDLIQTMLDEVGSRLHLGATPQLPAAVREA